MKTIFTKSPKLAAQYIKQGDVVAFPTETVYGLGASAFDTKAVAKIFKAKGRPSDNPLIVHVAKLNHIEQVVSHVSPIAEKLFEAFSPGPLTVILPKSKLIPLNVTAGLKTVGVRIPQLKLARDFIQACGVPIAAPSANISGRPSGTIWQDVASDFVGRIPCILKGVASHFGVESTVVDCSTKKIRVLRLGAVSIDDLEDILHLSLPRGQKSGAIKSPGMKYRHYAPKAQVRAIESFQGIILKSESAYIGLQKPPKGLDYTYQMVCRNLDEYAHHLYHFFRSCDAKGIKLIHCKLPPNEGLGLVIRDRIEKGGLKIS